MKNANAILTFICNFRFVDTLFLKKMYLFRNLLQIYSYVVARVVQIILVAFNSM